MMYTFIWAFVIFFLNKRSSLINSASENLTCLQYKEGTRVCHALRWPSKASRSYAEGKGNAKRAGIGRDGT